MVWLPWAALAAALALLGAWWASRRGDAPAALRRVGYAVGVLGLWALGVPLLLWRLWAALSGWAARLLLNPLSWIGLVATAAAVVLVLAGIAWGRRRAARPPSGRSVARKQPQNRKQPQTTAVETRTAPADEDAEIDAILRRHGIS